MTSIITRTALVALVDELHAARLAQHEDWTSEGDDREAAALAALGDAANAGTPARYRFAEELGPDYVCALDDGTIAAWGGDTVLAPGLVDRRLTFYSPSAQAL